MPSTHNGSVRLHWDEQGDGAPVLLVMGRRFSSRMWYPVIPALAERHRVVWFDNRGSGQSDATRHATIDDLVGDATAVLDAAGVEQAHVYGVSLGGILVQALAMAHPERVRSMVLGCTGVLSEDKVPRSRGAMAVMRLLSFVPERLLASRSSGAMYGTSTPPEAIEKDLEMLREDRATCRGVLAQVEAIARYTTTHEAVAALEQPALVLHGTADSVVKYEWGQELADTLRDARLVTFEGAGHNFIVADPDRANGEVLAFFAAVEGA